MASARPSTGAAPAFLGLLQLLLPLLLLAAPSAASGWRACGEGRVGIAAARAAPDPVLTGGEATFTVSADVSGGGIQGGGLEATVSYLGFVVFSTRGALCEALACPLSPGPAMLQFMERMPVIAPPVRVFAWQTARLLLCSAPAAQSACVPDHPQTLPHPHTHASHQGIVLYPPEGHRWHRWRRPAALLCGDRLQGRAGAAGAGGAARPAAGLGGQRAWR